MAALGVAGAAVGSARADGSPSSTGSRIRRSPARRTLRVALPRSHAAKLAPMLDRFGREAGARVEVRARSEADLYSTLAVDLLQQTASNDLVCLSDDWLPSLGRTPALRTGGDLAPDEVVAGVDARFVELGRAPDDERLVALPWTVDVGFTAVRDDRLMGGETPATWRELIDALAEAGTTDVGIIGAAGEAAATTFRGILAGYGLDIVHPVSNRPTVMDHEAHRAVELLQKLEGLSSVQPLAVDDVELGRLLSAGRVSACPHLWASTWLDAGAPGGWRLLPPLRASASRPRRQLRAWLWASPEDAREPELARDLISWTLSPSTQRELLGVGLVPSTRAVLADRDEQTARPAFAEIVRGLSSAVPRPRLRSYPEVSRVCGEAVAAIVAGNASAGPAFREADTEMRHILEREGELNV